MRIREFTPADAVVVSDLIRRTLREVNSNEYPAAIIERMCEHFSPERLKELSRERQIFLICEENTIIGTGSYRDDVIYSVFIDPDFHGKGAGKTLMTFLENQIQSAGYTVSKVPSSVSAVLFYEKLGYRKIREHFDDDFGTNIIMEKRLA